MIAPVWEKSACQVVLIASSATGPPLLEVPERRVRVDTEPIDLPYSEDMIMNTCESTPFDE